MSPALTASVSRISAILLAALLLAACGHEYECWCVCGPDDGTPRLTVTYDWSGADAQTLPEGMTLSFYPVDGSDYWLYGLPPAGGEVPLPEGMYDAVSYNSDTEDVVIRGSSSLSTLEAVTLPGRLTDGLSEAYTGPQPPSRDNGEPICRQPDMMWLADSAGVEMPPPPHASAAVTLRPRPIVCRYTVIIDNVANLPSASGMSISLSGLAEGYMLAQGTRAGGAVTMPGSIASASATSIAGRMLTFGPAPDRPANMLSLYVWLRDGSKREYRWDVSDQIEHPADGHTLTIHLSGVELPDVQGPQPPTGPGGGMNVDVDNWETVDINLST